jgi:uncharacterized membrane protein
MQGPTSPTWRFAAAISSATLRRDLRDLRHDGRDIKQQQADKRDSANTSPAEDAFLAAIAIAQRQKARSFELCTVLDLARLYKSAGRSADAHALLASALKGFSPIPDFPGIEEALAS